MLNWSEHEVNEGVSCVPHGSACPPVVPNSNLTMEVQLLTALDGPDIELMTPEGRIALAGQKRERGNAHYQRGDYAFAVNSYGIALQITEASSKGQMGCWDELDLWLEYEIM